MKYYLSLCAIVRNETPYLEEFVKFHLLVGVEHFFIFDNNSDIPVKDTLKEWVATGKVEVIDFPGNGRQMQAYDYCLQHFGNQTQYLAVADADEFIIPKSHDTVPEVLEQWEKDCTDRNIRAGAYALNWRIFGSNGHLTKPEGSLIKNYTKAVPRGHWECSHIKSIVMPAHTIRSNFNPHCFQYKLGYSAISEDFKMVPNAWIPHCAEKMQLNHYFCKSLEEFKIKISRPRADSNVHPQRPLSDWEKFDRLSTEEDLCALRFLEKLKE